MIQLQLETIAHCNAACVFCPYPIMERAKGTMSEELFRKIVDEAATIDRIVEVSLQGLGEPTIDKRIVGRIRYIRERMPAAVITMYTNGSLLTPEKVDELEAAGLTTLYVSLNAANAEKRSQIMKLDDYDRVVAVLDRVIRPRPLRIVVKGVAAKDLMEIGENEEFIDRWGGDWASGGAAFLHLEGNWAGQMGSVRVQQTRPCGRALGQIMVLWDGRVATCCFDGEAKQVFGDLNDQTIREVYASPQYVAFREAHVEGRRSEYPICAGCTAI